MLNMYSMSNWQKSSDRYWYSIVARLDAKLERIYLALASGQFCDKWGELLEVSNEVEYSSMRSKEVKIGVITTIENPFAVIDGKKIHWSYLVKK